jgi:hypothetical protein
MKTNINSGYPELQPEDRLWIGLEFPMLSPEELARQQADVEDTVHWNRGFWWRQARPFFWLPCFPYEEIDHSQGWPARIRSLAGYTHLAKAKSESNGLYRAIVRENMPEYSISYLSREKRKKVRHGLSKLQLRVLTSSELLEDGYEVYVSWHNRVQWGRNKCKRSVYMQWISKALMQPKRLFLGAYHADKLVAFMLPFACNGEVSPSYIASHSDSLPLHPNDFLYHALLTISRQTRGIRMAEFGVVSSKTSLNTFKLAYGKVVEFPSFTWINPAIRPFIIDRIRRQYPWLQGIPETAPAGGGNEN